MTMVAKVRKHEKYNFKKKTDMFAASECKDKCCVLVIKSLNYKFANTLFLSLEQ